MAAAAAGLLAVSPLAFAGDKGDDHGHRHHGGEANVIAGDSSEGLINVAGNNVAIPVNVCDNQVPVNVLGVQVPINDVEVLADLSGAWAWACWATPTPPTRTAATCRTTPATTRSRATSPRSRTDLQINPDLRIA
ncbi:hypothetical protein BJF78_26505 [Pseudonocardia sp. CNS-139]|nr:hypothetical protein BJF78_26505 [Pseudonocardia sp. CNS-139]